MLICSICNGPRPADRPLIDGSAYHQACYENLQSELQRSKNIERWLLIEIQRPISFGENIWMFFSTAKQQEMLQKIQNQSWKLSLEREEIASYRAKLKNLYDVWPTYPPDWEERGDSVRDRDDHACTECGVVSNTHIHHKRALKDGGTNKLENLVTLCSDCHSQAHGGVSFKDRWNSATAHNSLEAKIVLIQDALKQGRSLFFHYKKPDGTITKRTVTPRELRKLSVAELQYLMRRKDVVEKEGRLCLFGHCHLRNEKRTFAVSRMYKLELR